VLIWPTVKDLVNEAFDNPANVYCIPPKMLLMATNVKAAIAALAGMVIIHA
jgi:hypothetical protein